nr:NADPH-dependent FMN reductase [uncultured Desulfobulbus sp.]
MRQYTIAVIVGSLRKESFNRQLANALAKLAPDEFTFNLVDIGTLPLYNQDDDATPAPEVVQFKETIKAADGLLFVTPEYNRSIPGVLKNALDQASRPYGQSVWGGKPGAVVGMTIGPSGTAMAQQHLRNILAYLDVATMGQPEVFLQNNEGFFDENGNIGAPSRDFLQGWMDRFVAWVKRQVD